tara:strand:- start:726 stop:1823 length:1098 start_codon:yes stop_codon:yes gene_type:complete
MRSGKTSPLLKRKSIQITGFMNSYTSYGILTQKFAQHLLHGEVSAVVRPLNFQEPWGDATRVDDQVKCMMIHKDLHNLCTHEIVFHTPNCCHVDLHKSGFAKKNRTLFTLWESSLVKPQYIQDIHEHYGRVIVPNSFCKQVLEDSGIDIPVYICPLGADNGTFSPSETKFPSDEVTTFLCAGRMAHGGVRKGIKQVIEVFMDTFHNKHNVALRVKLHPDCPEFPAFDCRVNITRSFMDKPALAEWYRSGNAFVSISSEGWGWHQQEAQLCGLPLVGVNWGGLTNFFHGFECDYKLEKAKDAEIYEKTGYQPVVNEKDLREKMMFISEKPAYAHRVGQGGVHKAIKYTWENSREEFLTLLRKLRIS